MIQRYDDGWKPRYAAGSAAAEKRCTSTRYASSSQARSSEGGASRNNTRSTSSVGATSRSDRTNRYSRFTSMPIASPTTALRRRHGAVAAPAAAAAVGASTAALASAAATAGAQSVPTFDAPLCSVVCCCSSDVRSTPFVSRSSRSRLSITSAFHASDATPSSAAAAAAASAGVRTPGRRTGTRPSPPLVLVAVLDAPPRVVRYTASVVTAMHASAATMAACPGTRPPSPPRPRPAATSAGRAILVGVGVGVRQ